MKLKPGLGVRSLVSHLTKKHNRPIVHVAGPAESASKPVLVTRCASTVHASLSQLRDSLAAQSWKHQVPGRPNKIVLYLVYSGKVWAWCTMHSAITEKTGFTDCTLCWPSKRLQYSACRQSRSPLTAECYDHGSLSRNPHDRMTWQMSASRRLMTHDSSS